jgi:hypothetical protein
MNHDFWPPFMVFPGNNFITIMDLGTTAVAPNKRHAHFGEVTACHVDSESNVCLNR